MSILDIDLAERAIREFNTDAETLAGDRLVYRYLASAAQDSLTVAERVVLIDKVWDTQMAYRRPKHVRRVIESIEAREAEIPLACQSLQSESLETAHCEVVEAARRLLPIVMGHADGDTGGYTPYSFATKYLHWITGGHCFPIVDSYARAYVNRLQRQHGMTPRVWAGQGEWREDYRRWITFYSHLLRSLSPADRERLQRADYDSQPLAHRYANTLVRILDKAFYWLG